MGKMWTKFIGDGHAFDLSPLSHATGSGVSGLIGYELLKDLVVTIDYRNGRISFVRP